MRGYAALLRRGRRRRLSFARRLSFGAAHRAQLHHEQEGGAFEAGGGGAAACVQCEAAAAHTRAQRHLPVGARHRARYLAYAASIMRCSRQRIVS
jgi:hypothetical protein